MLIIGEKINGSIPSAKQIIQNFDEDKLLDMAGRQAEAGADYIDVNVGTGRGSREDEIQAMKWAVATIQKQIDKPLCIDSSDPAVLKAGLSVLDRRPCMINSTNAEKEHLQQVLPLAQAYNALLIALPIDENGIPATVENRLSVCAKLVNACENQGIPIANILFDPLVLPVATDTQQGKITLDTLAAIKRAFPAAKTVMGLSNISFGLPKRKRINHALMHMAIYAELDAAIADPADRELMLTVKAAEVVAGRDRHCRRYTRALRKEQ